MQKEQTHKQNEITAWFLTVVLIFTLLRSLTVSLSSVPEILIFPYFDKFAHLVIFGLLATALNRLKRERQDRLLLAIIAITISSLLGIYIEFRQSHIPGRIWEMGDIIADISGSVLAVYLYENWTLYRRILEFTIVPEQKPLPRLDDHNYPHRKKPALRHSSHAKRRLR